MPSIIIHTSPVNIQKERILRQRAKTPEQRFYELLRLNELALKLSGRKFLREPQGKGIVLVKKK
ncbi:MAG: hypothetical protein KGP35_00185 [Bacteroidetes bacterium]|nr:hypothetical protein [Bacteroidota bacterium]